MTTIKIGKRRIAVMDLRSDGEEPKALYAYAELKRGRACWLWIIKRCPFCGKLHSHGGGKLDGDPRRLLGSRVPHCVQQGSGIYDLTDNPELHGQTVCDEVSS
jgi:hypothetical protein